VSTPSLLIHRTSSPSARVRRRRARWPSGGGRRFSSWRDRYHSLSHPIYNNNNHDNNDNNNYHNNNKCDRYHTLSHSIYTINPPLNLATPLLLARQARAITDPMAFCVMLWAHSLYDALPALLEGVMTRARDLVDYLAEMYTQVLCWMMRTK
jgi:hypothetical protein